MDKFVYRWMGVSATLSFAQRLQRRVVISWSTTSYPSSINTGWWFGTPLKNIRQLGWLFPIYGKIENIPNHQPEYIISLTEICTTRLYHQPRSGLARSSAWTTGISAPHHLRPHMAAAVTMEQVTAFQWNWSIWPIQYNPILDDPNISKHIQTM